LHSAATMDTPTENGMVEAAGVLSDLVENKEFLGNGRGRVVVVRRLVRKRIRMNMSGRPN